MKNLLKFILIFFISFNSDASLTVSDNDLKYVIKNLKYRNVGPTRGGRVTAVHGVESQKNVFYMGTTGGGVWKTLDFGNNWFNVSDGYFKSPSIGAINVYQKDILDLPETAGANLLYSDFNTPFDMAAIANSMGGSGTRITKPEEIKPAIDKAVASGKPALLDIVIDGSL